MGLDMVELVMAIEERFQVEIPDKDLEQLATAAQIISYLEARTPAEAWSRDSIRAEVRRLIIGHAVVSEDFPDDARLIDDLHID